MSSLIRADDFGEDLEDKVAPEGKYDLRITSAKAKTAKSGRLMVAVGIVIEGGEDYATIFENVNFPKDDDIPSTRRLMLRGVKRFAAVFGIPTDVFVDISEGQEERAADIIGATGTCMVVQEAAQDAAGNETGDQRNILRLPPVR